MATAMFPRPVPGPDSSVTMQNVDWETYCALRDDESNNHLRMTYLDGNLTIMSPQYRHDGNSRRFFLLIAAVAGVWEIDFMPIGTTTLRRKGRAPKKGAGKEADEGFYLGVDEAKVRDNTEIDLAIDPPPTLAIEVDNLADSDDALPADARIGVPEVWIYKAREQKLWFGRLVEDAYVEVNRSVAHPRLTPERVLQALEARAGKGDRLWVKWLEEWAGTLPDVPLDPNGIVSEVE
jgi:Uma2 family endonuclease